MQEYYISWVKGKSSYETENQVRASKLNGLGKNLEYKE